MGILVVCLRLCWVCLELSQPCLKPAWACLGPALDRPWACSGHVLGYLGPVMRCLGAILDHLRVSWACLRPSYALTLNFDDSFAFSIGFIKVSWMLLES